MSTVADPAIAEAYEDVRNDSTPTDWLLVEYVDDKTDKLKLAAKGTGGLAEFKSRLTNDKAAFGYVRLVLSNDGLSKRAKFLLVTWVPPGVKVMRKAKVSVHISDVKQVIKVFSVEVSGSQMDELREDDILLKAKKAMGANYDRQASNYVSAHIHLHPGIIRDD
ncbi:actin depolymerizing protein [Gonapodya prolifera JEL478]|uniref:Actin depolymerizing protein n=1 Tax=Gonapodya prolifera (strain JEL478) TaxID=1344416 RepID=A0A139AUS4_GONPJ|nr:actin depolymerizing protein [Gonapodya prolifera JEL478]|eukprot:KXS20333.1 actin depolymerizing protein [Gonapodya prolifera JEL478]